MALSISNRGGGLNTTAGTSIACNPDVGNMGFPTRNTGVFAIAYDNAGTNGADPCTASTAIDGTSTITDTGGNVWVLRLYQLNDPGVASAGCVLRVYTCLNADTLMTDTITVPFGATNVTAKAWLFNEVIGAVGSYGVYTVLGGTATTTAATTVATTTGSPLVGWATLCYAAIETNAALTLDSDTTNGTWSAGQNANANTGTAATSMRCTMQAKVQTTTQSAQTWNVSWTGATDTASAWLLFAEATDATTAPAEIAVTTTLDAPTVTGDATASPAEILVTATAPDALAVGQGDGTATPAPIPVTVTVDQATATADVVAAPASVPLTVFVPAAVGLGDALAAPAALPATVTVPEPITAGGNDATATPAAIAVAVTVPPAAATVDGTANPAPIAVAATVPTPAAGGSAVAAPDPIVVTVTLDVPAAGVLGGGGVTLTTRPGSGVRTSTRPGSVARTGIRPRGGVTVENH